MLILSSNISKKPKGSLAHMYFNMEQVRELTAISAMAYIVMEVYVGISTQTNPNMEDSQIAKMLNKSTKTIEKARLALTKAGWFKRIKITRNGNSYISYHVGKQAVSNLSKGFTASISNKKS